MEAVRVYLVCKRLHKVIHAQIVLFGLVKCTRLIDLILLTQNFIDPREKLILSPIKIFN